MKFVLEIDLENPVFHSYQNIQRVILSMMLEGTDQVPTHADMREVFLSLPPDAPLAVISEASYAEKGTPTAEDHPIHVRVFVSRDSFDNTNMSDEQQQKYAIDTDREFGDEKFNIKMVN